MTESFAFLLESRTSDPDWLTGTLGVAEPEPVVARARAVKLLMLRRYAAKIAYEIELHGAEAPLTRMPAVYSRRLSAATRISWPRESWLSDVDGGFYVACYLRAWALETHWRRALRARHGNAWHREAAAGAWLQGVWAQGQRLDADELLGETLGERLEFGTLAEELLGV